MLCNEFMYLCWVNLNLFAGYLFYSFFYVLFLHQPKWIWLDILKGLPHSPLEKLNNKATPVCVQLFELRTFFFFQHRVKNKKQDYKTDLLHKACCMISKCLISLVDWKSQLSLEVLWGEGGSQASRDFSLLPDVFYVVPFFFLSSLFALRFGDYWVYGSSRIGGVK